MVTGRVGQFCAAAGAIAAASVATVAIILMSGMATSWSINVVTCCGISASAHTGSSPSFLIDGTAASDLMNFTNAAAPVFSLAVVGVAVA